MHVCKVFVHDYFVVHLDCCACVFRVLKLVEIIIIITLTLTIIIIIIIIIIIAITIPLPSPPSPSPSPSPSPFHHPCSGGVYPFCTVPTAPGLGVFEPGQPRECGHQRDERLPGGAAAQVRYEHTHTHTHTSTEKQYIPK
jgi:hypothetical protein